MSEGQIPASPGSGTPVAEQASAATPPGGFAAPSADPTAQFPSPLGATNSASTQPTAPRGRQVARTGPSLGAMRITGSAAAPAQCLFIPSPAGVAAWAAETMRTSLPAIVGQVKTNTARRLGYNAPVGSALHGIRTALADVVGPRDAPDVLMAVLPHLCASEIATDAVRQATRVGFGHRWTIRQLRDGLRDALETRSSRAAATAALTTATMGAAESPYAFGKRLTRLSRDAAEGHGLDLVETFLQGLLSRQHFLFPVARSLDRSSAAPAADTDGDAGDGAARELESFLALLRREFESAIDTPPPRDLGPAGPAGSRQGGGGGGGGGAALQRRVRLGAPDAGPPEGTPVTTWARQACGWHPPRTAGGTTHSHGECRSRPCALCASIDHTTLECRRFPSRGAAHGDGEDKADSFSFDALARRVTVSAPALGELRAGASSLIGSTIADIKQSKAPVRDAGTPQQLNRVVPSVAVTLSAPDGSGTGSRVQVMMVPDTGAMFSMVPASLCARLGIKVPAPSVSTTLATGMPGPQASRVTLTAARGTRAVKIDVLVPVTGSDHGVVGPSGDTTQDEYLLSWADMGALGVDLDELRIAASVPLASEPTIAETLARHAPATAAMVGVDPTGAEFFFDHTMGRAVKVGPDLVAVRSGGPDGTVIGYTVPDILDTTKYIGGLELLRVVAAGAEKNLKQRNTVKEPAIEVRFHALADGEADQWDSPSHVPREQIPAAERWLAANLAKGVLSRYVPEDPRRPWLRPRKRRAIRLRVFFPPLRNPVPGKDPRGVVDFRGPNGLVIDLFDLGLIPAIADAIATEFADANAIACFDISGAYDTQKMDTGDVDLLVVVGNLGTYRLETLPQGMALSPGLWSKIMETTLAAAGVDASFYVDDAYKGFSLVRDTAATPPVPGASVAEPPATTAAGSADGPVVLAPIIEWWRRVWKGFNGDQGRPISGGKSVLYAPAATVLGWRVDLRGDLPSWSVPLDPAVAFPVPATPRSLKGWMSLIGALGYLSPVVAGLQADLAPLRDAIAGGRLSRDADTLAAAAAHIPKVVHRIRTSGALAFPDLSRRMVLFVDASRRAVGAILAHPPPGWRGTPPFSAADMLGFVIIGVFSRAFRGAEIRYDIYRQEFHAATLAACHFQHLIRANQHQTLVLCDNASLTKAMARATIVPGNDAVARGCGFLFSLPIFFAHLPGDINPADPWSRAGEADAPITEAVADVTAAWDTPIMGVEVSGAAPQARGASAHVHQRRVTGRRAKTEFGDAVRVHGPPRVTTRAAAAAARAAAGGGASNDAGASPYPATGADQQPTSPADAYSPPRAVRPQPRRATPTAPRKGKRAGNGHPPARTNDDSDANDETEPVPARPSVPANAMATAAPGDAADRMGDGAARCEPRYYVPIVDDQGWIIPPAEDPRPGQRWAPGDDLRDPGPRFRRPVVVQYHLVGHGGPDLTVGRIRADGFGWDGIFVAVRRVTDACLACLRHAAVGGAIPPPLGHRNDVCMPRQVVAVDLMELVRTAAGNRYVLTITCVATGYIHAVALSSKSAAAVVSAITDIFLSTQIPHILISDHGSEVANRLASDTAAAAGFRQRFSTVGYSGGNALVERAHRRITEPLRRMLDGKGGPREWDEYLKLAVYVVNNGPFTRLGGLSPYYLYYGTNPRAPFSPAPTEAEVEALFTGFDIEESIKARKKEIDYLAQVSLPAVARRRTDKERTESVGTPDPRAVARFAIGARVMLRVTPEEKLAPRYAGPFTVFACAFNAARLLDHDGSLLNAVYPVSDLRPMPASMANIEGAPEWTVVLASEPRGARPKRFFIATATRPQPFWAQYAEVPDKAAIEDFLRRQAKLKATSNNN